MIEKRKLGKGLNALMKSSPENDYMVLSIDSIITNKDQPRKRFDEQRLIELAASIKQYGIIQPIVVKKEGSKYRIVAGERRFRAAKMAGLTEIKAILFKGEEDYQISLIENLQREDLNPIEVAEAYTELIKRFSYTQQELSEKVGKSRSEISNCMRLLNLTGKIQDLVRNGTISVGQARPLAVLEKSEQEAVLEKILKSGLTARQVEKIASSKQSKPNEKSASGGYWELQQKELAVHTKAKVTLKEKKTGISVIFDFGTISDFEKFSAIVRKLNK
ncbi:MAG TPA: ParB/RepB/Spo0J family partition protein [bacterium]|nr:ParB/RepB/Spo0J family partition protein [bacterium]